MQYCSMTTMFYSNPDYDYKICVEESLKRHADLGIRFIDLNMCAVGRFGEHQFDKEDWYDQAYRVKELADSLNMKIVQTHLPYPGPLHKFDFFDSESYKHMQECTLKAMKISNIVQAEWAVVHPVMNMSFPADFEHEHINENLKFYSEVIEESEKGVCGLAFENMADSKIKPVNSCFCSTVEQLLSLVQFFNSPKIKIAWDFGHANLSYGGTQHLAICKLGALLKAVHVNDNLGLIDDHFAPYQGNIDWDKILSALADIGFDGYWDFEIGKTYNHLPLELRDKAMLLYKGIADYMINKYKQLRESVNDRN